MTLLSYINKTIIQSTTSVNTTSNTLINDNYANKTDLVLSSKKTILAIYVANSNEGSANNTDGIHTAISINGTDYGDTYQTPNDTNCCIRSVSFWLGYLEAGTHVITGRFASNTNNTTSTIDNRTLLIYIFEGDEFYYITNTQAQSTSSLDYVDDVNNFVSCTPSGNGKALVLYSVTNTNGVGQTNTGTNICINVDDIDYVGCKASQSPYSAGKALSVTTAYALPIYNKLTTFKGRFKSNVSGYVTTVSKSYLAVLCFEDSTLLDISSSNTIKLIPTTTLADDSTVSIIRSCSKTYNLLTFGQATKNYNSNQTTYKGGAYGLKIIDDGVSTDVALSRSSSSNAITPYSNFVGYGADVTGEISIYGRVANNSTGTEQIDTRILIALWFTKRENSLNGTGAGKGTYNANCTTSYIINVDFIANPSEGSKSLDVKFTNISALDAGNIIEGGSSENSLPVSTTNANTIISRSSNVACKGNYSMSAIATSSGSDCWIGVNDSVLQLTKGQSYYWECRVFTPNATKINVGEMGLQEIRGTQRIVATGEINGNTGLQDLEANTWTKICGVGIIPNDFGGGYDNYRLLLRPARIDASTYDTTTTIYFDNLIVTPASFAWDYGDPVYGLNLLNNPSIEGNVPTGTTGVGASVNISTNYAHTGTRSMRALAYQSTPGYESYVSVGYNILQLELNTFYYWEVYIYCPVSVKFLPSRCYLQGTNVQEAQAIAKGKINGESTIQTIPANTWVKLSGQGRTPEIWGTDNKFAFIIRPASINETTFDATNWIYFDDFQLYRIGSSQDVIHTSYGNNILSDPSIETNLPVTTAVIATSMFKVGEYSHSGNYSAKIIAMYSSDSVYHCRAALWCFHLEMEANTNYYWEVYIYSPTPIKFHPKRCYIEELNRPEAQNIAFGVINGSEDLQDIPANTWVKLYGQGKTPSDWGSLNTHFHLVIRPAFIDTTTYDTVNPLFYDDFKICTYEEYKTFEPARTINTNHTYTNIGQYTPSLTVTTPTGTYTKTYENLIHVIQYIPMTSSVSGGNGTVTNLLKQKIYVSSYIAGGTGTYLATCKKRDSLHCNIIGHGTNDNTIWLITHCSINCSGSGSSIGNTYYKCKIIGTGTGEAGQQTAIPYMYLKIQASASGSGSSANRLDNIKVNIAGHGTYTTHITEYYHITSSCSGQGNTLANMDSYYHINASNSGIGSSISSIKSTYYINGTGTGIGTCLANIIESYYIQAFKSGSGTCLANANEFLNIRASKSGRGSTLANVREFFNIRASKSGSGTCSFSGKLINYLSGTNSGSGENTANLTMYYYISGIGSGEGSNTNHIYVNYFIESSVSGTGNDSNLIGSSHYMLSSVEGMGESNSSLIAIYYINGSGSGSGSDEGNMEGTAYMNSSLSGTGSSSNQIYLYNHICGIEIGKGKCRGVCFKLVDSNEQVKTFPVEVFPPFFFPLEMFWSTNVVQVNVEELSYIIDLSFIEIKCEVKQPIFEVRLCK